MRRGRGSIDLPTLETRLTRIRLGSYSASTGGDLVATIELYNWNTRIAAAFFEDLGRLEVVIRNAIDSALRAHAVRCQWASHWYEQPQILDNLHKRAKKSIQEAKKRAGGAPSPDKVIAELNFGFWRFLATKRYLTSLWFPAKLADVFPGHPNCNDVNKVRRDVEDILERLLDLRNRIAHHEPIHGRNLKGDAQSIAGLANWICREAHEWILQESRVKALLGRRPPSQMC